ncbi:MAG: MaoC/PaaZ C-terminal domain-containing protein [Saprospiraceae bacterium]
MQRCAIQGSPTTLTEVTGQYQYGGLYKEAGKHLFRLSFDELEVGQTLITHKRTITEADIVNFANVSWDHFTHTDETALEGTPFEKVAHGYFILSAAAGLFVDAAKGPFLLNYGLEECPSQTRLRWHDHRRTTHRQKKNPAGQKRRSRLIEKGIVKFLVDVYDETGETVAIATILTMVRV